MSVPEAKQSAGANPRTLEEARAFVKQAESLFTPWNVEGIKALMGDTIANTGKAMRGGRIAVWEAAFNVTEAGKASALGIV